MVDLFGRIVPFKLTVVVCETPPAPSNLMTPTSATGPTGPKATIEPLVAIPKEPFNVLTEHSSESALADRASDNASASVKTIVNGLLIFFITVHLTLGFRTLQQLVLGVASGAVKQAVAVKRCQCGFPAASS